MCIHAIKSTNNVFLGPGFNLALRYLDFQLGPFKLDKYTSPGVRHSQPKKFFPKKYFYAVVHDRVVGYFLCAVSPVLLPATYNLQ